MTYQLPEPVLVKQYPTGLVKSFFTADQLRKEVAKAELRGREARPVCLWTPDIKLSSHGKAFSAGWDAKAEQAPTEAKLDAFCAFIGSEPVENDGGWSLEVWNAAWEACEKEKQNDT